MKEFSPKKNILKAAESKAISSLSSKRRTIEAVEGNLNKDSLGLVLNLFASLLRVILNIIMNRTNMMIYSGSMKLQGEAHLSVSFVKNQMLWIFSLWNLGPSPKFINRKKNLKKSLKMSRLLLNNLTVTPPT